MLIYIATNRVNGKQYVGQTTLTLERRKRTHIWKSLVGGCSGYFYNAIRKYGQKNFVWKILHDNINSINYLNKLEIFYIGYHNTFENGYNLTEGGEGTIGCKLSKKTKENMSKAQTGRKHSEETKRKISESKRGPKHHLYGKHPSAETRQKMSVTRKEQKISEETKQKIANTLKGHIVSKKTRLKISESLQGNQPPNSDAVIINNKHFASLTKAGIFLGMSRHTVRKRLKKQIPGYRYVNKKEEE